MLARVNSCFTRWTHFTRFAHALLQGESASVASAMLKVVLAAVVYASEQQVRDVMHPVMHPAVMHPAVQPDQRRMLTYADVCLRMQVRDVVNPAVQFVGEHSLAISKSAAGQMRASAVGTSSYMRTQAHQVSFQAAATGKTVAAAVASRSHSLFLELSQRILGEPASVTAAVLMPSPMPARVSLHGIPVGPPPAAAAAPSSHCGPDDGRSQVLIYIYI